MLKDARAPLNGCKDLDYLVQIRVGTEPCHKHNLLSESEDAFIYSLSAVFVQSNAKIGHIFMKLVVNIKPSPDLHVSTNIVKCCNHLPTKCWKL